MRRIPDRNHAHAVFLGFVDCHLHGTFGNDHAHAVMTVNHRRGRAFPDDFKFSHRILDALPDPVVIYWFQSADAVRINPALIGGNQHVGADFRVFFRHSDAHEHVFHKAYHRLKRYPASFIRHKSTCILLPSKNYSFKSGTDKQIRTGFNITRSRYFFTSNMRKILMLEFCIKTLLEISINSYCMADACTILLVRLYFILEKNDYEYTGINFDRLLSQKDCASS